MTETGGMNGSDNSKKGSEDKEEKIRQNEPGKIKGTAGDTVDGMAAVSYTHLDVYKRQIWGCLISTAWK